MKWIATFLLSASAIALFAEPSWSYDETPVANGATLSGRVLFQGTPPPPRPYGLIVYPDIEICEKISDGQGHRLLHDFAVAKDGGFQNVVVVVEEVRKGKPFRLGDPRITARTCEFKPFMSVVRDGRPLSVQNGDSIIHDIQTYAIRDNKRGDRIFDRAALGNSTMTETVLLPKDQRVVWIQCGKHSFMQSWAYAVNNPYYAITGPGGAFLISDLPPGRYRVTAWHPFMKLREMTVEVAAGEAKTVQFEFGKRAGEAD